MDKNKDLAPEIEEVEMHEVDNVNTNDTDPNIMAVLRRKEEEQKQKDAERNKWLKIGGIILAAIILIVVMVFSLRSCSGNNDKPEDSAEHEHSYIETVVPPTETEDGYTLYSCEECGDSYKDNTVEALGKEESDDTTQSNPSETEPSETKPTDDKKPTTSKPTTSTDKDDQTNKPTAPSKPSTPSDDKTSNDQDSKPSKPSEDTSSITKPTKPEETKPTTPSQPTQPSEPETPPVETKCPHETTQHSGCRWGVSGCSCSHKHVEQKVGNRTHIYCEDETVAHRDGSTYWYPWKYYTETASNTADTSSKVTSTKPATSTAPETKPAETKPVESKPTENTTSTPTTTQPTPSESVTPPVEEETGCNHDHSGGCRYEQGYDCEHNHVEQKVGSRIHIYCEDVTVAHRDGKTYYYPWELYN